MSDGCEEARQLERRLRWQHRDTHAERTAAEQRADAYKAGRCVSCLTARHSPGRPRCEPCHTTYITRGVR